jgi:signal transduction histidine kinase
VQEQLPFESELIARLGWLIRLRWLAVAGMVLVIGLIALLFPRPLAFGPLWGVTLVIGLYNTGFALYLRSLRQDRSGQDRLRHATRFACTQIVLDLVSLAVLVYFSGGVENPMILFFVFHVIIASILLPRGVSYLMAGLASLLIAAVVGSQSTGLSPHYHLPLLEQEPNSEAIHILVIVMTMAVTLFLVAYLTTSIMTRLRERDRELWESNLTCQIRSGELEELNRELVRVDQERTRFMVLVTHELRAPINTIYSALDLAVSGYAPPEKTRQMLERAQSRADDLLVLIGDLLNLTRVREQEAGTETAELVQLEELLQEAVDFVQVEVEERGISLSVEIEPHLSPVNALPDQMKLVWTNLISNAIKYNRPGGRIEILLEQDERRVTGAVYDTGIGIDSDDLPHVFDEFYRAANAREISPHGTGVGLAIVRRIIENWGGEIEAASDPGIGTRFTFSLPRADAERIPA